MRAVVLRAWPWALLALALRLIGIGRDDLWIDEIATIAIGTLDWPEPFATIARLESSPPGYYLLMRAWIGLAGTSETALRLPSAIAMSAAVFPVHALARAGFGLRAAATAAALFATSPILVRYGHEARTYALLVLLFAVAMWATRRALFATVAREAWGAAMLLAAAAAAMLWLHSTAALLLIAIATYGLVLHWRAGLPWRRLGPLAAAAGLAVLAGLPWLMVLLGFEGPRSGATLWAEPIALRPLIAMVVSVWGVDDVPPMMRPLATLVLGLAALTALRRGSPDALALAAGLVCAGGLILLASLHTPILLHRTILFGLVLLLPLAAAGLVAAEAGTSRRLLPAVAIAVLIGLNMWGVVQQATGAGRGGSEAWSAAADLVRQLRQPGDTLVVSGAFEFAALRHYGGDALVAPPLLVLTNRLYRLDTAMAAVVASGHDVPLSQACARLPPAPALFVERAVGLGDWLGAQLAARLAMPAEANWTVDGVTLRRWAVARCRD